MKISEDDKIKIYSLAMDDDQINYEGIVLMYSNKYPGINVDTIKRIIRKKYSNGDPEINFKSTLKPLFKKIKQEHDIEGTRRKSK